MEFMQKNGSGKAESGDVVATKLITTLIQPVTLSNLPDLERTCLSALDSVGDKAAVQKHGAFKKTQKTNEKKNQDIFAKINSYSLNQLKNQSIRFGLDTQNIATPRQSWGFRGFGSTNTDVDSRDYEDVLSMDILQAPICDLCIVQPGDVIPDSFYRHYKTPTNKKANLNSNSGGNPIYLCLKKDLVGDKAHITNVIIIFPDREEFIPPGYFVVFRGKNPCNLNTGTSNERIFLCFKKESHNGNALTDVQIIFPTKQEEPPRNFQMVEKSLTGLPANLNSGTGGLTTLLCYRQRLVRIECLRVAASAIHRLSPANSKDGLHPSVPLLLQKSPTVPKAASFGDISGKMMKTQLQQKVLKENPDGPPLPLHPQTKKRDVIDRAQSIDETLGSKHAPQFALDTTGSSTSQTITGVVVENKSRSNTNSESGRSVTPVASHPGYGNMKRDAGSESDNDSHSLQFSKDPADGEESVHEMDQYHFMPSQVPEADEDGDEERQDLDNESIDFNAPFSFSDKNDVVDATGKPVSNSRAGLLHAILSCVYCRNSVIANPAMVGLTSLLETEFFVTETGMPEPGTTTMIDLAIDAACDRFDIASENEHVLVLRFLNNALRNAHGRFCIATAQRIFRTLSFVCTSYSTRSDWINSASAMPCCEPPVGSVVDDDISPYAVLQSLIHDTNHSIELTDLPVPQMLPEYDYVEPCYAPIDNQPQAYKDVRLIFETIIDEVIDAVEISRLTEALTLAVSKQSVTTLSSSLWQTVHSGGRKLFQEVMYRKSFMTLAMLCKFAWHSVRTNALGEPFPRDLGTKLLALDAINAFCMGAGEKLRMSRVMGYQVRKMVVGCLFYNVQFALRDHRIFSKLLKTVTALWKVWRHFVRIEFAKITEQLVIKILQATSVQIRPLYQMIVIQEVINWFDQPSLLVEMFVNYDMDRKFVSQWNTFSYLVRTVCVIGKRQITDADDQNPILSTASGASIKEVTLREVNLQALEEVATIAKTLMDASGHAYLIIQDSNFRDRALGATTGWAEDEDSSSKLLQRMRASSRATFSDDGAENIGDEERNSNKTDVPALATPPNSPPAKRKGVDTLRTRFEEHAMAESIINEAIRIYTEKGSLFKAVKYLLSKDFMPNTPQEIANFLRVYKNNFDPIAIGDFLGEGGITNEEQEYWKQIRYRYTRAVSFVEMELEPALRLFLTGCGFRLPGESQKIDRLVDVFVMAFWQDTSGTQFAPFRHADTVHVVAFAIIILNTELHKLNAGNPKKAKKKMTKDEFIHNLRGCDQGHNVDREYLSRIYDNVMRQPIEMVVTKAEQSKAEQEAAEKKVFTPETAITEHNAFIQSIISGMNDALNLLRSLSTCIYRFQTGINAKISVDLVSYMYDTVWTHFYAVARTLLFDHEHQCSMSAKFYALDILVYSLTSALFLDLKVERMTFAQLLRNFRDKNEPDPDISHANNREIPDNSWYSEVEQGNPAVTMETIAKVHLLMAYLKDNIQLTDNYELTKQVAAKFEKRARILENNAFLVRQGDLVKLSRSGRAISYRFFLFSDNLVYAKLNMTGQYKVHEQLSLNALTIDDVDDVSFFINHPVKSFTVVAETSEQRQIWVRDILQTANSCKKREITMAPGPRGRRMSIVGRLEQQQSEQNQLEKSMENLNTSNSGHSIRHHSNAHIADDGDDDNVMSEDEDENHFHAAVQAVPFSNETNSAASSPDELKAQAGYFRKSNDSEGLRTADALLTNSSASSSESIGGDAEGVAVQITNSLSASSLTRIEEEGEEEERGRVNSLLRPDSLACQSNGTDTNTDTPKSTQLQRISSRVFDV